MSLAWHSGGGALAAGSTEGHLVVLNADAGAHVATLRVCGSPLNCLQYNSGKNHFSLLTKITIKVFQWLYLRIRQNYILAGDTLAIGSQNGSIYLFRVSRDGFAYKKWNKIRGAQPLVQLDWSLDGNYLQTVTAEYDLAFCKYHRYALSDIITFKRDVMVKIRGFQGTSNLYRLKKVPSQ